MRQARVLAAALPVAIAIATAVPLAASCADPGDRVAVLAGRELLVSEGALGAAPVALHEGVDAVVLHEDRIGVLSGGTLQVKQGALGAAWVEQRSGVTTFALEGARIAVLSGRTLQVKEGALDAEFVTLSTATDAFELDGDRIAVITTDTLWVKEGPLTAPWVKQRDEVSGFALEEDRIAMHSGRTLWVKEGELDSALTTMSTSADAFALEGDRVAVVTTDTLWVKEGPLTAPWVKQRDGVTDFALEGDRVAMRSGRVLRVRGGALDSALTTLSASADAYKLSGNRVAVLTGDDLWVKDGSITAAWVKQSGRATGFDLYSMPEQRPAALTLLASATSSYRSASLHGTLTTLRGAPLRARQVVVQRSLDASSWGDLGTATTTPGGALTIAVEPTSTTHYRLVWPGDAIYAGCASAPVTVTPRASLTTPSAPLAVRVRRSFSVSGYVQPGQTASSTPVRLLCYRAERQRNGAYRWALRRTVTARGTSADGRTLYRAVVALPYAGRWRIRAHKAADALNTESYSGFRYLAVR